MKKIALSLLAIVALASTSACMRYNIKVGKGGSGPAQTVWDHHFLWSLVGEGNVDVAAICNGSTDATIHIERTFIDGLLSTIVFGGWLWEPSTVQVQCGEKTAEVAVDRETAKKLVGSAEFLDVVEAVAPDRLDDAHAAQEQLALAPLAN